MIVTPGGGVEEGIMTEMMFGVLVRTAEEGRREVGHCKIANAWPVEVGVGDFVAVTGVMVPVTVIGTTVVAAEVAAGVGVEYSYVGTSGRLLCGVTAIL